MHILLDMDGVMFDSEAAHAASFAHALHEHGIPFTTHDFTLLKGKPACEIISVAAERSHQRLTDEDRRSIMHRRTELLRTVYLNRVIPHPDLPHILTTWPVILWTNARRENAYTLLSLLKPALYKRVRVISIDLLPVGKPHPLAYASVRTILGTAYERIIFVDDTYENIIPAQRKGMHAIHYTLGFRKNTLYPLLLKILSGLDVQQR